MAARAGPACAEALADPAVALARAGRVRGKGVRVIDDRKQPPAAAERPARPKTYEAPRVIDYGKVSKLTQNGGITTKDNGNMKQICL